MNLPADDLAALLECKQAYDDCVTGLGRLRLQFYVEEKRAMSEIEAARTKFDSLAGYLVRKAGGEGDGNWRIDFVTGELTREGN